MQDLERMANSKLMEEIFVFKKSEMWRFVRTNRAPISMMRMKWIRRGAMA